MALDMGKYRARLAEGYHYNATENQKTDHAWAVTYNGAAAVAANTRMEERTTVRWEAKYGKTRIQLAAQSPDTVTTAGGAETGAKVRFHRQKYNKVDGSGAVLSLYGSFA